MTQNITDVSRPVIGSFLVNRKGWRWTQWTMLPLAMCTIITTFMARETFHPVLKSRRSKISSSTLPLHHHFPQEFDFSQLSLFSVQLK
jgi:MFS family permease